MDWTKSMQQTFEYYEVDPATWKDKRRLEMITSCTIERDDGADTLGSASFDVDESLGECYIRTYLIAIQNGEKNKIPIGTHLAQSPSDNFDGKKHSYSVDGFTPLIELKENVPPFGFNLRKGESIMDNAYQLTRDNLRAPVVSAVSDKTLVADFISDVNDTWFSFLNDLIANGGFTYDLDDYGRILFSPDQDTASMMPVFTYDDGNSSILYPEISVESDIYNVPNVVEILYSLNSGHLYSRIVNDDPNSPTSTVSRGREIVHREMDPELYGIANQAQVDEYAEQLLRNLSSLDYRITYTHGFNLVRPKDCVRLNYERAGLVGVKAKVVSQSIQCGTGCSVQETAVFTRQLWR